MRNDCLIIASYVQSTGWTLRYFRPFFPFPVPATESCYMRSRLSTKNNGLIQSWINIINYQLTHRDPKSNKLDFYNDTVDFHERN